VGSQFLNEASGAEVRSIGWPTSTPNRSTCGQSPRSASYLVVPDCPNRLVRKTALKEVTRPASGVCRCCGKSMVAVCRPALTHCVTVQENWGRGIPRSEVTFVRVAEVGREQVRITGMWIGELWRFQRSGKAWCHISSTRMACSGQILRHSPWFLHLLGSIFGKYMPNISFRTEEPPQEIDAEGLSQTLARNTRVPGLFSEIRS
jgi:hypothetical protein